MRNHGCVQMPGKGYLIRFRASSLATDIVFASRAEIQGDHLVFLHSVGSVAALAMMEIVQSWSEIDFKTE